MIPSSISKTSHSEDVSPMCGAECAALPGTEAENPALNKSQVRTVLMSAEIL